MKTSKAKTLGNLSEVKNTWDMEVDVFEIHTCPVCGVADEFNMNYKNFLCRHCGKATTRDLGK